MSCIELEVLFDMFLLFRNNKNQFLEMFLYTVHGNLQRSRIMEQYEETTTGDSERRSQQLKRDMFLLNEDPSRYRESQEEKDLLQYILTRKLDLSVFESLPSTLPILLIRLKGTIDSISAALESIQTTTKQLQDNIAQINEAREKKPNLTEIDAELKRKRAQPPSADRDQEIEGILTSRKNIVDGYVSTLQLGKTSLINNVAALKKTMSNVNSAYEELMKAYRPKIGNLMEVIAHCQKFIDYARLEKERIDRVEDRNRRYEAHNRETPLLPKLEILKVKPYEFPKPVTRLGMLGFFVPEGDLMPIARSSTEVSMENAEQIKAKAQVLYNKIKEWADKVESMKVIMESAKSGIEKASNVIATLEIPDGL